MFPEGHKLAAQNCPNGKGFPYALFETLLFRLSDPCMESMLAEVIPHAHGDDLLKKRLADTEANMQQAERALDRLYAIIKKPDTSDSLIERTDRDIRQVDAELTRLNANSSERGSRQVRHRPCPQNRIPSPPYESIVCVSSLAMSSCLAKRESGRSDLPRLHR
jgi:hypothetical protein